MSDEHKICPMCRRNIKDEIEKLDDIVKECQGSISEYMLSLDHEQSTLEETLNEISELKDLL